MDRLAGGVGAGVADDDELIAVQLGGVRDEHDVLVPAHELPLAGGPAHDETADASLDLLLHERVVRGEVHLAVGKVRGLESGDEARLLDLIHARGGGLHRAVGPRLGGDALRERGRVVRTGAHAGDAAKRASGRGGAGRRAPWC